MHYSKVVVSSDLALDVDSFFLLLLLRMKMKTHLMRRTKIGKSKSLRFDCLSSKPFRTMIEKKNLVNVSQKCSATFKTFFFFSNAVCKESNVR